MNDCYVFATGGSGGHLMPALAVAEEIRARSPQASIVFVGSQRPVERSILEPTGYAHLALPVQSLGTFRRHPLRFLRDNGASLRAAREALITHRPRAVIGCGGFASVPAVYAAARLGVPIMLLEQNAVPGRATSWLSRKADVVCLTFESSRSHLATTVNCVVTGNPVRRQIAALAESSAERRDESRQTLLVLGGSQGARAVNSAVTAALGQLSRLAARWTIIHQTGNENHGWVQQQYRSLGLSADVRPFLEDIPEVLARADLAVSRAGGTTLAELACAGVPALLVPAAHSVRDHQQKNAEAIAAAGAAVVVSELEKARLAAELEPLLTDDRRRLDTASRMAALARPHAAADVLSELDRIA